jgi:hypothetical protein
MVLLGAVSALLIVVMLAALRHVRRAVGGGRRSSRAAGRARRRSRAVFPRGPGADAAFRRHPAGRGRHAALVPADQAGPRSPYWTRPTGPDDDPEFIDALARLIRGDGTA